MRMFVAALALAASLVPAFAQDAPKNDYAKSGNWLCLPGQEDACATDEDATIVKANGTLTPEKFKPAKDPGVDCFYIYPTVSLDPGINSDMIPGREEMSVIAMQFARFGAVCKTYAPLYRQFTITSLVARMSGKMAAPSDPLMAYHDVVDAWNYYLAHYNNGRGVILIGHSQGSGMLTQLIKNEIDGKPVQKQIVLAILGGTRLSVPAGKDAGGDFPTMPLCHSATTPGCVIAFASFRSTVPPPAGSLFGKVQGAGLEAACVNPAALSGGSGAVHPYMATNWRGFGNSPPTDGAFWVKGKTVTTPFVSLPGMLTAECARNDNGTYLSVTVHGDPADPRTDDISGDTTGDARWGLHLVDMNLFMGDMLDVVRSETRAYLKKH